VRCLPATRSPLEELLAGSRTASPRPHALLPLWPTPRALRHSPLLALARSLGDGALPAVAGVQAPSFPASAAVFPSPRPPSRAPRLGSPRSWKLVIPARRPLSLAPRRHPRDAPALRDRERSRSRPSCSRSLLAPHGVSPDGRWRVAVRGSGEPRVCSTVGSHCSARLSAAWLPGLSPALPAGTPGLGTGVLRPARLSRANPGFRGWGRGRASATGAAAAAPLPLGGGGWAWPPRTPERPRWTLALVWTASPFEPKSSWICSPSSTRAGRDATPEGADRCLALPLACSRAGARAPSRSLAFGTPALPGSAAGARG
jgi:hypothetical protein